MQPGYATLWAQGQGEPATPTAARIITVGDPGLEPVPDIVDSPHCRMTRHGVSTTRCRIIVKPGTSSESAFRCRSLVEALTSPECGGFPLLSCPPESNQELVSSVARGYKMYLSGGLLLGAAGPAGVQDVPFAGSFVPQEWNQHAYQSASRPCPVGMRLRLYLGVPASFHRFDFPCKLLYTSRTSPKDPIIPRTEGRCLQGSPFGTLHPGLQSARLDDNQNDNVPFNKKVAYRCAECIGFLGTPHSSLPNQVQMRPTAPGMASPMNPLTRAYLEPLGSLKLGFSVGTRTAERAAPPLAS